MLSPVASGIVANAMFAKQGWLDTELGDNG
jgi:hypothetical protein